MTSNDLFTWLLASGGLVAGLSWLFARWGWYEAQGPELKQFLFVVIGTALAAGVHALQLYVPPAFWLSADPWIQFVSGTVILLMGAKAYHIATKE